ncbi:MAG: hypothetical protein BGO63_11810 [Candidatus Accumulibacter sp. 66-26]|nr:hypothetical protein [Accumulibacter sp.]OJW51674.1 MAG: hypothetical protein BGO63_11810 [Candidatus Accumulibacter sp. 66-26]
MNNKSCATCRHHQPPTSPFNAGDHRCMRRELRFSAFDPIRGARTEIRQLQPCGVERSPGLITSVIYGLVELRKPYCGKLALWHDPR